MPYPNMHAAPLRDPKDFKERPDWATGPGKFRTTKGGTIFGGISVPATIEVVWGQLKNQTGKAAAVQTLHFLKEHWTVEGAKQWLKRHNIRYLTFEPATDKAAEAAGDRELLLCDAIVDIQAAQGEGDAQKPPRFLITAYTGGILNLAGWPHPVVVDLVGMEIPQGPIAVLRDHDQGKIVGHAEAVKSQRDLTLQGVVSGTGEAAREVVDNSKKGFPWRASIGARSVLSEYVAAGASANVNGQAFTGPLSVVRKSKLAEVSFVPVAADVGTMATVLARASITKEESRMDFEKWLEAKGFKVADLTEEQKTALKTAFDAEIKAQEKVQDVPPPEKVADTPDGKAIVAEIRAEAKAEVARIHAVVKACGEKHPDLLAKAIAEGWTADKAELEVLRADRPKGLFVAKGRDDVSKTVIEAAIRLGGVERSADVEKEYKGTPEVLEAAHRYRRIGLRDVIAMCCAMDGIEAPRPGAGPEEWLRATFSTDSLNGILGTTANKIALAAYAAIGPMAALVAVKLSANDFTTHTGYRLTGDSIFKQVGPDGELKHMSLGEDKFTFKVDTYGAMVAITRQHIINDDLNVFSQIPQMFGRGAGLLLEDMFWTLVLANTGTFFAAGNNNYISGATTVLSDDGLSKAVETFQKQVDQSGRPIKVTPRFLVVPPELGRTADKLYVSGNLVGGTATVPGGNVHEGKYQPLVVPYLSNASYSGYSATAWYLFGDPRDVAAFGIAYLRGNETPVFEEIALPGNVLGQGWRGYFDIGVCQVDPRGAVKSKGAA